MAMCTLEEQQQSREINISFIQQTENVLWTDGCYCSRPRAELEKRLLQGEDAGPSAQCQLYAPKEVLTVEQLRRYFRSGPASSFATSLQHMIIEKASQPRRQPTPPLFPLERDQPLALMDMHHLASQVANPLGDHTDNREKKNK